MLNVNYDMTIVWQTATPYHPFNAHIAKHKLHGITVLLRIMAVESNRKHKHDSHLILPLLYQDM